MNVSGHTATYRSSVAADMHLIGERYFLYRFRVQCDRPLSTVLLVVFFCEKLGLVALLAAIHDIYWQIYSE